MTTLTPGDDTYTGNNLIDLIYGEDGNDLLRGLGGNDTLYGGAGQDRLHGGTGNDIVNGDEGDDKLFGQSGNDMLLGGAGHDIIKGDDGDDIIIGGGGSDALFGGAGADVFRYTAPTDSMVGSLDFIYDFQHGIDKIDLRDLGYTGFTTGHASATQLRLAYSAATDRTYLRDDHSDFEIVLKGDYRGVLTNDDFQFRVSGRVGYYEAAAGTGDNYSVYGLPATKLGYEAVSLDDVRTNDLTGLDAVFLFNQSNDYYGAELLSGLPDLADYVLHGGVLIIHDRYVDGAEQLLPGLTGEDIVRDFTNDSDINFVDRTGVIADGPGGHLSDSSLDNGTSSSHGFAFDDTLDTDIVRVLTTTDPDHIVSFAYAYGAGAVYYSSIPLDAYLYDPESTNPLLTAMRAYAENVVAWAVGGHHDLGLL